MASKPLVLVPIAGTELPSGIVAQSLGPASANEFITVTVKVRSKDEKGAAAGLAKLGMTAATERTHVSREDFAAIHGADPADLKKVADYATSMGLSIVESSSAKRRVVLAGKVADFEKAFGVKLERFQHPGGTFRSHLAKIQVPADLQPLVVSVMGLSNRPVAKPHFQQRRKLTAPARSLAAAAPEPFTSLQVAQLYNFPAGLDGTGQCIAIIELGGGYLVSDLQTHFTKLGVPMPTVTDVAVLGGSNTPGGDADGEVMLDIEVAGAIAPKARIVVYFAPNTNQGFAQAITDAAHDAENKPSVISISWGGPESSWGPADRTVMSEAIRDAGLMGVTVTVAAGDNGSADGVNETPAQVDFPASSPYALACGGTRLEGSGAAIESETVWNDGPDSATGGGVSDSFPRPDYQADAHVPKSVNPGHFVGRGVPDVAGNADPDTGYEVRVDGQDSVIGGTSAVAPLWAGLIALFNQKLGRPIGFLNPLLYTRAASSHGAFQPITQGNNGAFQAGPGWNACAGLGSPNGSEILNVIRRPDPTASQAADQAKKAVAATS